MKTFRKKFGQGVALILGLTSFAFSSSLDVPSLGMRTISEAMIRAKLGDTIYVSNGVYKEHIMMAPGVTLVAKNPLKATIDGKGKGTCVTMSKGCAISGFEIRNGTIGVFSNGSNNQILSCRIIHNWQTGIVVVRHLPKIEDNIIAFNKASGIQGWDVRSTTATVNHNTIAFNSNHGIALGGSSEIVIENNIIAFNERFGLKILKEQERVQVANNNFYRNLYAPSGIPAGNFSFDPAFTAPRAGLNFKLDPALCCKAKGTDNLDLGTRIIY